MWNKWEVLKFPSEQLCPHFKVFHLKQYLWSQMKGEEWARVAQTGIFQGWIRAGSPFLPPTHLRLRELSTGGEGCSSSQPQHCRIPHRTPKWLQQGRLRGRISLKSSGYSVLLGRDTDIKHSFTCKGRSPKPHFLMCTACAWGRGAPALSSSLTGKWGHIVREGLRHWVVPNTLQHCSCAASYEQSWTAAFLSLSAEIQLHHLLLHFSHVFFTHPGSDTGLIPQNASAPP